MAVARMAYLCKHDKNKDIINKLKSQNDMAYVISSDCVACGTCIDECPSGAISEGETSPGVHKAFGAFSCLENPVRISCSLTYKPGNTIRISGSSKKTQNILGNSKKAVSLQSESEGLRTSSSLVL